MHANIFPPRYSSDLEKKHFLLANMDPISFVSLYSGVYETTRLLETLAPSKQLLKITSEMQILVAIFSDAAAMLDSLTTAAPASAGIALEQCQQMVINIVSTMQEYSTKYVEGNASKKLAEAVGWSLRNSDNIKEELATFRTAVTLLREIANE